MDRGFWGCGGVGIWDLGIWDLGIWGDYMGSFVVSLCRPTCSAYFLDSRRVLRSNNV